MTAKKKDPSKLSGLGQTLERSLDKLLKELDSTDTVKVEGKPDETKPRYSLLDKLRVYDRALKLEAIRHKITDDEGSFYTE